MTSEMRVMEKHGKVFAVELREGERGDATSLWPYYNLYATYNQLVDSTNPAVHSVESGQV
jgi:hypothetical protein